MPKLRVRMAVLANSRPWEDYLTEEGKDEGDKGKNSGSLFDLIIADYNVPELSGLEVVEQAREKYREYNLLDKFPKVIMITTRRILTITKIV